MYHLSWNQIETLWSYQGDGNENFKNAISLILKTAVYYFFDISFPSLHDYKVKMTHFTFCRTWNKPWQTLLSLSELGYGPWKFNCKRVCQQFGSKYCKWVGIFVIKTERMWIHFLSNFFTVIAILGSYWTPLLSMLLQTCTHFSLWGLHGLTRRPWHLLKQRRTLEK